MRRCAGLQAWARLAPLLSIFSTSLFLPTQYLVDANSCLALPNPDVALVANWDEKRVLMFTPKGGASVAAQIFLKHEGLLEAAEAYHHFVHKYRMEKLYKIEKYRHVNASMLRSFCKEGDALCFHVLRSPLDRAVSSYIHTMRFHVMLPTVPYECYMNAPLRMAGLEVGEPLKECAPGQAKDSTRNLSFKSYLDVLQRISTGAWTVEKPKRGCENGARGGTECRWQQWGALQTSNANHWQPQTSFVLKQMREANVPVHFIPTETIGHGALDTVKGVFGYKLEDPHESSFQYIKKDTKGYADDVAYWDYQQINQDFPPYEYFFKYPEITKRVCCLFAEDVVVYREACAQPWLLSNCPKCSEICKHELQRLDNACGESTDYVAPAWDPRWSWQTCVQKRCELDNSRGQEWKKVELARAEAFRRHGGTA